MHPPLHISKHPYCKEAIEALTTCHAAHPYAKFWGACNDHKWALDRCLRQEKVINRKVNLEKARTEQARLRSRLDAARARQEAAN